MDLIKTYNNTIPHDICEKIINMYNDTNTIKVKGVTSQGLDESAKKTTDYLIDNKNHYWKDIDTLLYDTLHQYLFKYFEYLHVNNYSTFDINNIVDSGFQIQKYDKNVGFFSNHNDFHIINENHKNYYRILVYIFYLNDVDEGGETVICNDLKITPKKGTLLLFPTFWTYPHKGNMPISNDKYIVTGWIYTTID